MTHTLVHPACAALLGLALTCGAAAGAPKLPDFGKATFAPGAPIDHPYFPILDGLTRVFEGSDADGNVERFELTLVGPGPVILGVQTTARRDRAFEEGRIVEDTFDYYAQDTKGNVWYFGEDVTNYRYDDAGNLIGTDHASAWRAGVNDALPGWAMPAKLQVGKSYYQEFAEEDEALDVGETSALGLTLVGPLGTYQNVLRVLETNELEPDDREFKYYAPGVGLIRVEEGLDEGLANPRLTLHLTSVVPEVSAHAMLLAGLVVLAVLRWRRREPR
jgi:hypothetical protein